MAADQTFEEEFLTCGICTEIYINPCTLNCRHSLCRSCLISFLYTRPDAVNSGVIPCPFCRQDTIVPRSDRPIEEWAQHVKPSLTLLGLMDRHHVEHSLGEGKDACSMCAELGETIPASSWCSVCEVTLCRRCVKRHFNVPATKKHDIYDLSEGVEVKQRRKVKCTEHEGELMKFVCKDCNKAICQTCCLLKHAKHNFVTVESIIPEMKEVLTNKRRMLQDRVEDAVANLRQEESKIEQLKDSKKRHGEEIKSVVYNAIALLQNKGGELVTKLNEISDKQVLPQEAYIQSGQNTIQMCHELCDLIAHVLHSESEMMMYNMYEACVSGVIDSMADKDLHARNTTGFKEVKFTSNIEPLTKAISQMGDVHFALETKEFQLLQLGNKHDLNAKPEFLEEDTFDNVDAELPNGHSSMSKFVLYDIKDRYDFTPFDPIDVTVLYADDVLVLIIADWDNKCLKALFAKKKKKRLSILQLSDNPSCVTKISRNRVASVVLDFNIVIAEVRHKQPKLVFISKLKTKTQYSCLTSLPDSTLAAGSDFPPAVDILDLGGKVLRSLTPHNTGLNLIQSPDYLCTTHDGNILVSDYNAKSIYCLTSEGKVVLTYTPTGDKALREPRGITVTNTGDILLADSAAKKILILSSDVRDVLTWRDDIGKPMGLCVDERNNLYVCDRYEDMYGENIKVFKYDPCVR